MKNVPTLRFKDDNGRDFPAWRDTPLEKLASVERGKFTVRPRNDPKYFGGKTPFIQTGDIVASGLYLKKYSQTLNEDGLKVSKLFPVNTILITIAANIGDTTITSFDVACTDSVVAIQPLKNIAVPVWIKYSLDTKKEELDSKATQNAQKNINLQVLKPLIFSTPCFREQTKIADFLTAIDDRISQLAQKCDGLAQYKKGVMQKIFSQELRFKDEDGRAFPAWEEKRLGDFCKITTGKSNREDSSLIGEYTFFDRSQDIRTSDIFLFDCEAVIVAGEGQDFIPKHFIGKFDLHQRTYAIIGFDENHGKYIFYNITYFRNYFLSQAVGSTVKSLRLPMFEKMPIKLPCVAEQMKIAGFLAAVDAKISQAQAQRDALKQYKLGLLQQMFV